MTVKTSAKIGVHLSIHTDFSYETTPKWHGFLMIRLDARGQRRCLYDCNLLISI